MIAKAVLYVTRGRELLVFTQRDHPSAGVQVPKGTVDPGETPDQTALREGFEETGLAFDRPGRFLGVAEVLVPGARFTELRHHYWFEAPPGTPDVWDHVVSGGPEETGLVFRHRFVPLEEVALDWELGRFLPALEPLVEA